LESHRNRLGFLGSYSLDYDNSSNSLCYRLRASPTARRKRTAVIRFSPFLTGAGKSQPSGPTHFHRPVRGDANAAKIWAQFASPRTYRAVPRVLLFPGGPACQRPRPLCLMRPAPIQRPVSGKGCAAASNSARLSMALHHWPPPLPILRCHQWPSKTASSSLYKRRSPWPCSKPEHLLLPRPL
jgi:hypothetical protein